jgi:quercetin dioxygenase-like cupin family protein
MQVTHGSKVEWTQVSGHRSGQIDFKRLLQDKPGALDNFEPSIVRTTGDYITPRHRHNFDQVRFCLEGAMNFATNRDRPSALLATFPRALSTDRSRTPGDRSCCCFRWAVRRAAVS